MARFYDLRKEELYPKQVNIIEILYVEREREIMVVPCRNIRTRILEKRFLVGLRLGVISIHIYIFTYSKASQKVFYGIVRIVFNNVVDAKLCISMSLVLPDIMNQKLNETRCSRLVSRDTQNAVGGSRVYHSTSSSADYCMS